MYKKIQSLAPNAQSAFATIARSGWAINSELDHININLGDHSFLVGCYQRDLDPSELETYRSMVGDLGLLSRDDIDTALFSSNEVSAVSYKTFALPQGVIPSSGSPEFKIAESEMAFIAEKLLYSSPVRAVRYSILRLIESGQPVDSISIANFLSTSVRSLQRNLAGFGTNLKSIRDDIRRRFVLVLLASKFSPKEIQKILGFDTAASLYRNFQLWYGMTPKQMLIGMGGSI